MRILNKVLLFITNNNTPFLAVSRVRDVKIKVQHTNERENVQYNVSHTHIHSHSQIIVIFTSPQVPSVTEVTEVYSETHL